MEGFSFSKIIFKMKGELEDKLNKEKMEAAQALKQYEYAKVNLEFLKKRLETINNEIADFGDIEERFKTNLQNHIEALCTENPEISKEVVKLKSKIGNYEYQLQQITEAEEVLEMLIDLIDNMDNSLSSASGWGTLDILGGGFLSSMIKRDHIDEAVRLQTEINNKLSEAKKELIDVEGLNDSDFKFDGVLESGLVDIFFDNIFTDLKVQGKIGDMQENCIYLRKNIETCFENLKKLRQENENHIVQVKEKIDDLGISN